MATIIAYILTAIIVFVILRRVFKIVFSPVVIGAAAVTALIVSIVILFKKKNIQPPIDPPDLALDVSSPAKSAPSDPSAYLTSKSYQKYVNREKQIGSFTIDDMYQFVDIPFVWSHVMQLQHLQRKAWIQLNWNNQQVALDYIMQVNQLIVDAHSYVRGISKFHIIPADIDFDFPIPLKMDSINNTYVECVPYTPSGNVSKHPVIIHFSSSRLIALKNGARFQEHPITGEIKILRDGNIGMADVVFSENNNPLSRYKKENPHFTRFRIGLFGLALVVKRIDNEDGNLFKFDDYKNEYLF